MTPTTDIARWETPSFEEIRMDSEIGSYQQDDEREFDVPPFVGE